MNTARPDDAQRIEATLTRLLPAIEAALPRFLERQRWFAAKGKTLERVAVARCTRWRDWLWLTIDVVLCDTPAPSTQSYSLPLAVAPDGAVPPDAGDLVAHVDATLVYDAFADTAFCRALIDAMRAGERVALADGAGGSLEFSSTQAFARLAGPQLDTLPVRRASASSSNTTVLVGDRLFLKAYRRLAQGVNPEVEMGRFLTDASPYAHIAPLAGAIEYRHRDGTPTALVMLQGQVANGRDAWSATLAELRARLAAGRLPDAALRAADAKRWSTLGRRTGELHRALARPTGDADFDPRPVTTQDIAHWTLKIAEEAAQTLDQLGEGCAALPDAQRTAAQPLLAARAQLIAHLQAPIAPPPGALVTRYHGDYHLGQVLATGESDDSNDPDAPDFVIIDFEGEPSRPLAERRARHSPLRDVAGMLRSFNYAAQSALGEHAPSDPAYARHVELVEDWERRARAAFLAGYREALPAATADLAAAPSSATLLGLFLFEKACYELRYELAHRPDWVHVPLGGLIGLLAHAADERGGAPATPGSPP